MGELVGHGKEFGVFSHPEKLLPLSPTDLPFYILVSVSGVSSNQCLEKLP